ncbi:MAG: tRNA (adenosine(37)-N6)-threonylcarbamoyltransferase complex dimerization subunit type 1 TsaB [Deltaproteobacteria bacterium]|nr:tRNA (adenosine(37)-N6)-threonylcarbamoyltransferase complex dimerization subunit type 1 TsaB [Deltaproteobacteria bacterium]
MDPLHRTLLALADQVGGPLLGLDTSGAAAAVCTVRWRPGEVRELQLDARSMPSESVGQAVAAELDATALCAASLAGIVVGIGPGSFTGLRVGLALAKGLSLGTGVGLYAGSSLAMLAASAGAGLVAPVLDARRGEIFGALYDVAADGTVAPVLEDQAATPEAFARAVVLRAGGRALLWVGSAAASCAELQPCANAAVAADVPLRAALGILQAAPRLRRRQADLLGPLAPRYLKLSEAERGQQGPAAHAPAR